MPKAKADATSNVVVLRPKGPSRRRSEQKWGPTAMKAGFCIIPAVLLRAQRRLGLSSSQLAFLLQVADFWWTAGDWPFPKKETLAQRLGLSEKQVQRLACGLEKRGYLKRIERKGKYGRKSNGYDLSGLVKKLNELAPEFTEAAAAKRKVERRGGLRGE